MSAKQPTSEKTVESPSPEMGQIDPIVRLLAEYRDNSTTNVDKALWSLLERFKSELPALDGYFHKAFRQCDCVDVNAGGHIDSAIWCLLEESELFWELFEKYAG